jgi:histidinol-phosphate aminotransferase
VQAIEQTARQGLVRYPDPMATAFRLQASSVLGVPPDWILAGNGSDDILTIITRALVGPGELLRLPTPSYILYRTLAELQGARYEEVSFRSDWNLPEEFGATAPSLRLVVLPNPNSPSGTVIGRDAILRLANQLPCPLLVDEAYADFAETNCVDLVKQCERIIVSRTFSKSYALAGLRFGYLVAQPGLVEQFVKVKDSYNCDALSIAGATAAMADQEWLRANCAKVLATRVRLTAGMRELGFRVPDSQANFVWCQHPTRPVRPLYEALKAEKILVRYMNYGAHGEGLRISVGTDDQIDVCLASLGRLLAP